MTYNLPCISQRANFILSLAFSPFDSFFSRTGFAKYGPILDSDLYKMESEEGSIKNFDILKKIGEGAFGQVY